MVLHLHGAMVSEAFEDCEGEILRRIRLALNGKPIPIVVTLDLHGNITNLMCEHVSAYTYIQLHVHVLNVAKASILIAVRTYPHIDFYECAVRACGLLQDAMLGAIRPLTVLSRGRDPVRRQLLRGLDGGKTTEKDGPMNRILAMGQQLEDEKDRKVLVVSVCAGFTASDIYDAGLYTRPRLHMDVTIACRAHRDCDRRLVVLPRWRH